MFYTIVGTQWGDEGKGKIVDWLSSKADLVVRFQGRYSTRRVHVSRKHDSRNPLVKRCPGTYDMACVT